MGVIILAVSLNLLLLCFIISMAEAGSAFAQNLVPNANFEIHASCPIDNGEIYLVPPWNNAPNTSLSSTDYFHICSPFTNFNTPYNILGFQQPLTGFAYAGIFTFDPNNVNLREYVYTKLYCPLEQGITYQAGFFVSRANYVFYAADRIGMYVGDTINGNGSFMLDMYVPQIQSTAGVILEDTVNWIEVSGTFTAQGNEKYIAIGNFFSDSNTLVIDSVGLPNLEAAYYYIDSVYVIPLTPPPTVTINNDTVICEGNSVTLQANNSSIYYWFKEGFPLDTLGYSDMLTVTPDTTTTYLLQTCAVQLSVTVQVVNSPVGSFSLGNDTTLCTGNSLTLTAPPYYTYQWQDGSTAATYTLSNAGLYHVAVSNACGTAKDTIAVNYLSPPVVNLGNDTLLCPAQTLVLNAANDSAVYLWQNNTTAVTYTATQTGVYWVRAENQCGVATDTIAVNYISPPVVEVGNDTTVCGNTTLLLNAVNDSASYLWQNNSTQPTYSVAQAGNYWVRVTNQCGVASDTLTVNYLAAPVVNFGNDTLLCPAQTLLLDVTNDSATYLWQNNSTNETYSVTQTGTYWARVENQCGITADTIAVNYINPPEVDLGNDTTLCNGETLLLDADNDSATYLWQDNSTNETYTVAQVNMYWVRVSNQCGITSDTLTVNYLAPPVIDFGNDTLLCPAQTLLLDATNDSAAYLWQDNTVIETYTVTQNGVYWASVENQCGTASDTVEVNFITPPTVELGNDTTLCGNTTLLLNAVNDSATYLWQDNSTDASYTVTETNTYWVQVSNQCALVIDTIDVLYLQVPVAELGNDTAICPETSVLLDVELPQVSYLWQDGSTASSFTADTEQIVWVVISNFCGIANDTLLITMKDCDTIPHEIVLPNIITPNDDGVNDVLEIAELPQGSQLFIYNRWGKRVYQSNNYLNNWDAKDVEDGTYFYVIFMSENVQRKGFLQLIK
jgi:gliding motility-associated-like protein